MKRALLITVTFVLALSVASENTPPLAELCFRNLYDVEVCVKGDGVTPAWVLFFFSNTCPVARRYMPRIALLDKEFSPRGVRFIGINASPADSLQDIAAFARDFDISYPVLKDVSFTPVKALGVTRTPEVAVLDRNFALFYRGRIDDQYRLGGIRPTAAHHDLKDALDALLAGKTAPASRVPAEGCAITYPDELQPSHVNDEEADIGDTIFTHEFRLHGAGEAGERPGTWEWELTPVVERRTWISAIEVKGDTRSANILYMPQEGSDKRQYIAGGLAPGQPVVWNRDEGISLPGGTRLRLSTPASGSVTEILVRLALREEPPVREISCSRAVALPKLNISETLQLIPTLPAGATLHSVAVDFNGFGAGLAISQVGIDRATTTLLSLPVLDPARPITCPLSTASSRVDALESIRATLLYPEYLRSPVAETSGRDAEVAGTTPVLSLFLYSTSSG